MSLVPHPPVSEKPAMEEGPKETQGSSQWILLEFPQNVLASQIHIQFQGGFSSRTCTLEGCQKGEEFVKIADFYPEDANTLQVYGGWNRDHKLLPFKSSLEAVFVVMESCNTEKFNFSEQSVHKLKISFLNSTDFFGRIVVYHLDVLGC